jgi:hypothetical protein
MRDKSRKVWTDEEKSWYHGREPMVAPEVTKGQRGEVVETHPSYAQIGASRVSGNAHLYGSDFNHQHYISLTIRRSEQHRDLSRDWPFAREELIEVALSESQWASFVSTLNSGMGTQCTLTRTWEGGEYNLVPRIKQPTNKLDQFRAESAEDVRESIEAINKLRAMVADLKISEKQKKALDWQAEYALRGITTSQEFVAKQFAEHMEDTTERAKTEINAYVEGRIHSAGLDALAGPKDSPIQFIEHKGDDDALSLGTDSE